MTRVTPGDAGVQAHASQIATVIALPPPKRKDQESAEETLAKIERRLALLATPENSPGIIDPRTNWRKKWDILMILLLFFTATVTPYEVAFMETKLDTLFVINTMVNLAFIADMFMNFCVAYQKPRTGEWVCSHKEIIPQYLRTWFLIDLVSVLPFDLVGVVSENEEFKKLKIFKVIRLLRLLKLLRILRASRIFKRWESQMSMKYSVRALMGMGMSVFILAHWIACAHRLIPVLEGTVREKACETVEGSPVCPQDNWMDAYGIDQFTMSNFRLYTISFYWSVMTLTTIGYGDIPVTTHSERWLAVVAILVGAGMYGYMVGAICGIIASMDPLTTEFQQTMDSLNSYMDEMDLPGEMRLELRAFFHHCKNIKRLQSYESLLDCMSPALQGKVTYQVHGPAVQKVYFLNAGESTEARQETKNFTTRLSMRMQARAYSPQETVIEPGSIAKQMYIVESGLASRQGVLFTKDSFFGDDFILTDARRLYHVIAVQFLDVFEIEREDLMDILGSGEFPRIQKNVTFAKMRLAFTRRLQAFIIDLCDRDKSYKLPASYMQQSATPSIEYQNPTPTLGSEAELAAKVHEDLDKTIVEMEKLPAAHKAVLVAKLSGVISNLSKDVEVFVGAQKPRRRRLSGMELDDMTQALQTSSI